MKKTLIALAALAATGAAFAQSSVTISGRIDLGHANIKTTDLESGVATKNTSLAGDQHGRTTSRLTFSGVEDLGGGLKAAFNYETRLNPDNTAAAGLDRTRNMFLNVSGGFGGVTIGTYLNPIDVVRGFSGATYSAPGGDFLANHTGIFGNTALVADADITALIPSATTAATIAAARAALGNGLSGRSTNSIGYSSPSFGGVSFNFGMSSEKNDVDGVAATDSNIRGYIGSVAYAAGPLNARLAFGQAKVNAGTPATETSTKTNDTAFAVSYNLGMAVPYLQHERTKTTYASVAGTALGFDFKTQATEIGATFPMGALTPHVSFGFGKVDDVKTRAFQVGTTYNLSKRTYVYGAVGQFKVDELLKQNGYKLGVVHQF